MKRIPVLLSALVTLAATSVGAQERGWFFDDADTDKNGSVSRAEYIEARTRQFDTLDRNGDGFISAEDYPSVERHDEAAERLEVRIDEADTDQDGKVSRAELATAPAPLFERADTNHDGVVTEEERAALRGPR